MKALVALGTTLVLFILVPLIVTFISVNPKTFEGIYSNDYLRSQLLGAIVTTFEASAIAILILLITGVPIAYVLSRKDFPLKNFVESVLDLPMVIPHSVAGIMILLAYASGPLGGVLRQISLNIVDSIYGTIAVMVFVGAPFLVNTVRRGFDSIPRSAELVARSLGASKYQTFLKISLPMVKRNILTGTILAWARGISEVGALLIVAYNPMTLSVLVYDWYTTLGLNYALSVTLIMLILSIVVFIALRRLEGGEL
ncbi:tungstate/molybdate transporter permease [Ignicoccus pacificus DSM 13166]|uniref:Tungstate/molybdate transporter permease n=1 Tax=Ignicoccus pacificus DSM 13166 TaxID=940294 RepID=A0A977K8X1_9CREN|nr:tungstate/molybdate transporter permease [Ignicoccus pacificus DSM 13166]